MGGTHKRKILYIMGIDWDWIFQRPQILERHLEEQYEVTVVFPRSILRGISGRLRSEERPQRVRVLHTIPRQESIKPIGWASAGLARRVFRDLDTFDACILGYPLYYRYIPDDYAGKVLYDCMDYYPALYPDPRSLDRLLEQEKRLLANADVVVTSAERLREHVIRQIPDRRSIVRLIRNGTHTDRIIPPTEPHFIDTERTIRIGYFGTIDKWFDYELLLDSLRRFPNVEYHLMGPMRKPCPEACDRIIYEGVVPHRELPDRVMDYDCLVMPFVVNDIVKWVDPVKLYEYIAMGKCIISVRYPEIERFSPLVYLYSDGSEYRELLENGIKNGFRAKYNAEQQLEFLKGNSWQERFRAWDEILREVL